MARFLEEASRDQEIIDHLIEKLRTIERSNTDSIAGVFVNATGTYHVPIQYFLESNGYRVFYVDARVTASVSVVENLGKVKSDKVDVNLLASASLSYEKAMEKRSHVRDSTSVMTRLLEIA